MNYLLNFVSFSEFFFFVLHGVFGFIAEYYNIFPFSFFLYLCFCLSSVSVLFAGNMAIVARGVFTDMAWGAALEGLGFCC